MSDLDPYSGLAAHYDRFGWDWFAHTSSERLFDLIDQAGLAGCAALEAGCGTGTLALALAKRGHRVTGVDVSESLLEVARRKDEASLVAWRRTDLTRLEGAELGGPFDLVTCVGDVLNHLESLDAWDAALRGLAAQLRPGGRVFLDLATCRGLERLDKFSAFEAEGHFVLVSVIYEPPRRRSVLKLLSFARVPGGDLYARSSETIPEWGHPVAAILERLARAGFADVQRLGSSQQDPEAEDRLALFARKA